MSEISFKLIAYGNQYLSSGAYLDPSTYANVDALLSGQWRDLTGEDPDYFPRALVDLALFCDIFCIRDNVMCYAPHSVEGEPRFLSTAFRPHQGAATKAFSSDLMLMSFLSIDDEQRSRILSRWFAFATSDYVKKGSEPFSLASTAVQEMMVGVLVEELLQASAYIPGARSVESYLATDPREIEFRTHNLFTSAMSRLDAAFGKKIETRAALFGVTQPRFPPILAMILDRVSSPAEIAEELLTWRRKFRPLRRRFSDLAAAGRSEDLSMMAWEKEYKKLNRDIAQFLGRFELRDSWEAVPGINPWDVASGHEKLSSDGWTRELNLKVSSAVKLGLDSVLYALRRARIRPLPTLAARLGRLRSTSTSLERVFGRAWTPQDDAVYRQVSVAQERQWNRYRTMPVAPVNVSRPRHLPDEFGAPFKLDSLFDEFIAWANMGPSKLERAETVLNVGLMSLEDEAFPRARGLLVRALTMVPRSRRGKWRDVAARGTAALGRLYGSFGKQEEAEALYRKALSYDPANAWVLNDYGAYLARQGATRAEVVLRAAAAADPGMEQAWLNLGILLEARGEHDDATECFHKAAALNGPHAGQAFLALGNGLLKKDDHAAAAAALKNAVRLRPKEDKIWSALAGCLAQAGDFAGAHQAASKANEINPALKHDTGWVELSAELARLAGDYQTTIDLLKTAVTSKDATTNALYHYALANQEMGNRDIAAKCLRKAHRIDPGSKKHLLLLFRLQNESADHEAALRTARLFARAFPSDPVRLALMGDALMGLGDVAAALDAYRAAVKAGLKPSLKFYNLAVDREQVSDWKAAIEFHELEIAVSGGYAPSYANMAADRVELGDVNGALTNARAAVAEDPSDPLNRHILANIYLISEDYSSAKPLLSQLSADESAPVAIREAAAHNLAAIEQDASKATS